MRHPKRTFRSDSSALLHFLWKRGVAQILALFCFIDLAIVALTEYGKEDLGLDLNGVRLAATALLVLAIVFACRGFGPTIERLFGLSVKPTPRKRTRLYVVRDDHRP